MNVDMWRFIRVVVPAVSLSIAGCGGGGGGGNVTPPPPTLYSIGGTLSGLAPSTSITLANNGGDSLTLTADGTFHFATQLKSGSAYAVTISGVPNGERCRVDAGTGAISGANVTSVQVRCAVPQLALVAGGLGGPGSADGTREDARFYYPLDMGADQSGNLYVADGYNRTIRKIDVAGNVTTLAGAVGELGTADGVGSAARFSNPYALAVDPTGIVYVLDLGVNTIRRIATDATVSTLAGTPNTSGTADGTGPAARFTNLGSIRLAPGGDLFFTDNNLIRRLTPQGVVTTIYTGFTQLAGIAIGDNGIMFVTDISQKQAVKVDTNTATATVIGSGFNLPVGIGIAPASSPAAGTVYVTDDFAAILASIEPNALPTTLAGAVNQFGFVDATGAAARFYSPGAIFVNADGTLDIADAGNSAIRQVTQGGVVTTIAGSPAQAGEVNGVGSAARFTNPEGLAGDPSGNVFVADAAAIHQVTPAGGVSDGFSRGGVQGFVVDGSGNAFFTDTAAHTINEITPSGTVTVIAGSAGAAGSQDGTGTGAQFNSPIGIARDASGNFFIADTGNRTIRKMTPAGVVTTLAGTAGVTGTRDGTGAAAEFMAPVALSVDADGTVFVIDGNRVRRITSSGEVTFWVGSTNAGFFDATDASASFNTPSGIALGPDGSLFVADAGNHAIRDVSSAGAVTTIAGVGSAGVKLGDLPGSLNVPVAVAYVDSTLYIAEAGENSLLAITGWY